MQLLPIKEHLEGNNQFRNVPDCEDSLQMCIDFYKRVGYTPPWICYYVQLDGLLVANAAYKGKPIDNKVEIAYGTFPKYQHKGIGFQVVQTLVKLALQTNPTLTITAKTLMEENYSVRILRKSNFHLSGTVMDEEDGEIWEWVYQK